MVVEPVLAEEELHLAPVVRAAIVFGVHRAIRQCADDQGVAAVDVAVQNPTGV